jgi:hypothetical protein
VQIPGLIQGYGVAQDFVTQGVESPAIYDTANGPQAVVNANLFSQYRVDLRTATVSNSPFALATIPAAAPNSCPTPNSVPPTFSANCTLVPFTTSASLGKVLPNATTPQVFQAGSSATDVVLGITQTPGFGIRVDNGIGGWDPATGANLAQYNRYIHGLAFFAAPAIADVTGDGTPDILQSADSGALMGFDGTTGQPAAGFPKYSGGWSLFTPATGDVTGTGQTNVALMTREGYLSVWSTAANGCTGNSEAWHWHQDDRNTGHYGTDTRPPSAITDLATAQQGSSDVLSFTAVGDNWKCGTAAAYQLFTSSAPITQDTVGSATAVTVTQVPGASGAKETITVPASKNKGVLRHPCRRLRGQHRAAGVHRGPAHKRARVRPRSRRRARPRGSGDRGAGGAATAAEGGALVEAAEVVSVVPAADRRPIVLPAEHRDARRRQ